MEKPSIRTIVIIVIVIIIGLYAIGEVHYFSKKIVEEKDIVSPVVTIPAIGVHETINNVSISQGVYHESQSYTPTNGEVILFGHRTLQGSSFLRLNELQTGDIISIQWPGIGEVNYTVTNQTIVPGSYTMSAHEDKNNIFLITCDPIGSTANRLIVEGNMSSFSSVNEEILNENPQQYNALIVMGIFLILGLAIAYFTPKETRIYTLITVAIIMVILIYFYLFPIPSDAIYSKINWLNGGFMEV